MQTSESVESFEHHPVVSVIIATYNRAEYIGRAIESVLDQTFSGWELIIIDDGSTDGTEHVVERYQDPRINYEKVEHGERSRARNIGINMSRGKYIAFLDSDDWYLPHKLALQVEQLENEQQAGMALGGWLIVNQAGEELQKMRPWQVTSEQPAMEEWLFSMTSTPITVLVRKAWLEEVGGFDESLFMSEDIELWIRLALAGCRFMWTKDLVGVVLVHGTNSLRGMGKVRKRRLDYLDKLFSMPEFCRRIKMARAEVYARNHLTLAWLAYDSGLLMEGEEELRKALELTPELCERHGLAIETSIIDYAFYFLVADPIAFVEKVFKGDRKVLNSIGLRRRDIVGKTWMSIAWRANAEGDRRKVRTSVFHAIRNTPASLANRGIQAMLLRSILTWRA